MHFSVLVNTKTDPFLNPDEIHRLLDRYQSFDGVVTEGMELRWEVVASEAELRERFHKAKLYNTVTGDVISRCSWPHINFCPVGELGIDNVDNRFSRRTFAGIDYWISRDIIQDYDAGVLKFKTAAEIYPNILSWWRAEEAPDYLIISRETFVTQSATDFAIGCNIGLYGEILVYDGKDPNDVFVVDIVNDDGIYDWYTIGGRWKNTLANAKGEFVNTIRVSEWDTKKHAIVYMTNVITDTISSLGTYSYEDLHRHLKSYRRGRYLKAIEGMDNTVPFDAIAVVKNFYKMLIDDAPSTWTTWGIITEEGYFEKDWSADSETGDGLAMFNAEFERRLQSCPSDSFLTIVDMHY